MALQYEQILNYRPKPFVKWAGGKRQLIVILDDNMPQKFGKFFEPFLGGGALFFHILSKNQKRPCSVSDLNSELILTYQVIRDKIDELLSSLQNHSKNYFKNSNGYYYKIRESNPVGKVEKASRLLFLNRTCFNGLYRVNKKGKFNVPLGRYSNPNIINEENLRLVSYTLQSTKVSIACRDFSEIVKDVKKGDFVYFDPPYQPISNTSNFTSYTNREFSFDDQKRLWSVCEILDSKGCKVLLSNSYSKDIIEIFSHKPWKIVRTKVNRAINSDSHKRTGHFEILVKNY